MITLITLMALAVAADVSGLVLDDSNEPLGGATIEAHVGTEVPVPQPVVVQTDEDGRFVLEIPEGAAPVTLRLIAPGHATMFELPGSTIYRMRARDRVSAIPGGLASAPYALEPDWSQEPVGACGPSCSDLVAVIDGPKSHGPSRMLRIRREEHGAVTFSCRKATPTGSRPSNCALRSETAEEILELVAAQDSYLWSAPTARAVSPSSVVIHGRATRNLLNPEGPTPDMHVWFCHEGSCHAFTRIAPETLAEAGFMVQTYRALRMGRYWPVPSP